MPKRPPAHKPPGYKTTAERRAAHDVARGSAHARGYDRNWQRLRLAFLAAHPLCECDDCQAGALRVTASQVVDHIKPVAAHPELRLAWDNLRAMSKRCHDRRTAREQGFAVPDKA